VGPMHYFTTVFMPVVWVFKRMTTVLSRLLGLPERRDDRVTPADILAIAEAGAQAGVLARREHQVIENVIELDTRTVTSAMTGRDSIVHFLIDDSEVLIRARIDQYPHSTYLVCQGSIDHVLGSVDSKDLLRRLLNAEPILLKAEGFRHSHEDFAVIVNEYSLVMGIITINDVMSTVMGDLVTPLDEEQIVRRDDNSWLIDGMTPIQDVMRALGLDELPQQDEYETLAGFLMVMLRRIPRRTDTVEWGGCRFEVLDVDNCKIDQVMVSRLPQTLADGSGSNNGI
jgi:CBS domain containing-hemolysin-like protein